MRCGVTHPSGEHRWLASLSEDLASDVVRCFKRPLTQMISMDHGRRTSRPSLKRPRPSDKSSPRTSEPNRSGALSATPSKLSYAQELLRHQYAAQVDEESVKNFVNTLHEFTHQISGLSKPDDPGSLQLVLFATSDINILLDLYQEVCDTATRGAISHTPVKLLSDVITILRARIRETNRCLSQSRSAAKTAPRDTSLGLISAVIVLSLLCAPNSPRSFFIEELIESAASLLRLTAQTVIFPACDPMFKSLTSKSDNHASNQSDDDADHDFVNGSTSTAKASSARRGSKGSQRTTKEGDTSLQVHFNLLLDEFASLFRAEHFLPDSVVSHCSSVSIQCMSVSGVTRIQSHALKVAAVIFLCYPSHRLPMLNDLRQVIERVPLERRMLRTYQLSDSKDMIRFPSALFCTLLAVATGDASLGVTNPDFKSTGDSFELWSKIRLGRFNESTKLAIHFLEPLVSRACSDRDPEFRSAFQTFFEDLLTLYGKPDWPVVAITLQTLSHVVIMKLRAGGSKNIFTRSFAIDSLGAIVSRMGQIYGSVVIQEANPSLLSGSSISTPTEVEAHRENLLLFLGTERSLHFAAACSYFEALFLYEDSISAQKRAQEKSEKNSEAEGERVSRSNENILRNLYADEGALSDLKSTTLRRRDNLCARRDRGDLVERPAAEDALKGLGVFFNLAGGFKTLIEVILDGLQDPAPTVRTKSIRALSAIDDGCQALFRSIPDILALVQDSCRDVSTLVRDAALDLLSRSMFIDESSPDSSTRSLGKSTSQEGAQESSGVFGDVFETVVRRLSDTATSVRKRAISIIGYVLSNALRASQRQKRSNAMATNVKIETKEFEERIVKICSSLVSRLDDPEGTVKNAAEKVLRLALFHFDPSKSFGFESDEDCIEARKLAERLVSVFMNLQPTLHSTFLTRVVNSTILTKHKLLLQKIVSASVDRLHSHEAEVSKLVCGRTLQTLCESDQKIVKELSAQRIGSSSVILALARLDASLVEEHCQALAPILKDVLGGEVTEADLITVQKILHILEVGVTQNGVRDPQFFEEVLVDIEAIVCKSPTVILEEAAVRCMCAISGRVERGGEVVLHNAKIFKTFLDEAIDMFREHYMNKDLKQIMSLERNGRCAAIRLGLLSRYGAFGDALTLEVYVTLSKVCASLASFDRRGHLLKAGTRALSHFLVRHRSFIGDGAKTLVDVIETVSNSKESKWDAHSENLPVGIQLCVLQGFHDLLKDEEDRNVSKVCSEDGKAKDHTGDNLTKREVDEEENLKRPSLAAEEDAEAGFLALGAQIILPSVIRSTYSSTTVLRRIVASVMGLLVRQGLLLPATVVPCLLTLLLDQDVPCRELSMRVVAFLSERYGAMLASAIVPSLRLCFKRAYEVYCAVHFQHNQGKTENSPPPEAALMSMDFLRKIALDPKTGQSVLSGALMALRRDQRKGILCGMIREFDPNLVVVDKKVESNGESNLQSSELLDSKHGEEEVNGSEREIELMEIEHADQKDCTLATLSFFGTTLACLDFTNGAGFGGSLTQGGGTVAADGKMRIAREDVNELVSHMTRIVSNSGQAILQVARKEKSTGSDEGPFSHERKKMLKWIVQMCLLLQMKHHLKVERWKSRTDPDESTDICCTLPEFQVDTEVVERVGWSDVSDYQNLDDDLFKRQVKLFVKLMREDAIDEKDITSSARRNKRNGARTRRNPGVTVSGRKQLKQVAARATSNKRAEYEGIEDLDGDTKSTGSGSQSATEE